MTACTICDSDRHPQDAAGVCAGCRSPDRSAPSTVLTIALEAAVPLHILGMQRMPWQEVERIAHESADIVAAKGDDLQFGGRKGSAAMAFNGLARGLAALAFCPGGVKFAGLRFAASHPDFE
ncbi:hypothetical protein [Zavarzinia sp.]|jgi:hypothetical protein|uniref:hypothetical protein n=1 Tax=Zavarzinia sp. TaxID=2027920 RepID=UPI003564F6AF